MSVLTTENNYQVKDQEARRLARLRAARYHAAVAHDNAVQAGDEFLVRTFLNAYKVAEQRLASAEG